MNRSIVIIAALLLSCAAQRDTTTLRIASKSTIGWGVAPQRCLLVMDDNESEWTLFYSQIEGFDYQEGYEYVVSVE